MALNRPFSTRSLARSHERARERTSRTQTHSPNPLGHLSVECVFLRVRVSEHLLALCRRGPAAGSSTALSAPAFSRPRRFTPPDACGGELNNSPCLAVLCGFRILARNLSLPALSVGEAIQRSLGYSSSRGGLFYRQPRGFHFFALLAPCGLGLAPTPGYLHFQTRRYPGV